MKQIRLEGSELGKLVDVPTKEKDGKEIVEKWTTFVHQTMVIINGGSVPYENADHYRRVRKAIKSLLEQKRSREVVLESEHYRLLWGEEGRPGLVRRFGGWASSDLVDEYLDAWENAKEVSANSIAKERKK